MIKSILLVVVGALAVLLIYAATRPDVFRVERSAHIDAPPEKVYAFIDSLHQMNRWNPFVKKDPAIQGSYSGPERGAGARYDFAGNKDVGKGHITVTGAVPSAKVDMALVMTEPFAADNVVEFTLKPDGPGTRVTWVMHGASPYLAKVMGVVFNMDKMVGGNFDTGLADLKKLAEAR